MGKTFEISLSDQTPEALIARAKDILDKNDGKLYDAGTSGKFFVKGVEGSYALEGRILKMTVTKKPFFVPWSMVENHVKQFFS